MLRHCRYNPKTALAVLQIRLSAPAAHSQFVIEIEVVLSIHSPSILVASLPRALLKLVVVAELVLVGRVRL